MTPEDRKVKEVLYKLEGLEMATFATFIKEQHEPPAEFADMFSDRDGYIADQICDFFSNSGMENEDILYYADEGATPTHDGWAVQWLEEGIRLYHDCILIGTVKWCYRGNQGSCWINEGKD